MNDEHDPWNNPEDRHPRANELMADELWSCVDEDAPFGSDEGALAYDEYRAWRHAMRPLGLRRKSLFAAAFQTVRCSSGSSQNRTENLTRMKRLL